MKTLTTDTLAQLRGPHVVAAVLVRMDLSETLRLNTSNWDLEWEGSVWRGTAGLGSVEAIQQNPGDIRELLFELPGVQSNDIALALREDVRGRPVYIYTAFFDNESYQIIETSLEWAGVLSTMTLADSGESAKISVSAEPTGVSFLRQNVHMYTDADQKRMWPGDRGLEFLVDQAEKSIVWPAASFHRR